MKRILACALSGVVLSLVVACSGGGGGGGSGAAAGAGGAGAAGGAGGTSGVGPGPNRSIEEACQMDADLSKPWCDYAAQCCSQADQDDLGFILPRCNFGPDDPAECVTFVNERIADGTMAFDGTWADACIGAQSAGILAPPATCDGLPGEDMILSGHGAPAFAQIAECRKMWKGLVPEGQPCEFEVQCAEGLTCQDDGTGSYACAPVGLLGSPCISSSDCDDDLVCNWGVKQCSMLGGTGAACLNSDECENGLMCDDQKCATPLPLGASCATSSACAPGTACSFTTTTCVNLKADGEPCSFFGECAGRCDETLGQCVSICGGDSY